MLNFKKEGASMFFCMMTMNIIRKCIHFCSFFLSVVVTIANTTFIRSMLRAEEICFLHTLNPDNNDDDDKICEFGYFVTFL